MTEDATDRLIVIGNAPTCNFFETCKGCVRGRRGAIMGVFKRIGYLRAGVVLILLAWLVPHATAYLDDPADRLQNQCKKNGLPDDPLRTDRPGYLGKVRKIRLTDDGAFVDRCELTDVLYELNWDTPQHPGEWRPKRRSDVKPLPKLVVFYIHGWKHSAAKDDGDFLRFGELIEKLASANADEKQVLGVYIGWNAASKIPPFTMFPLDNLTFWSKQAIADRIAQSAVTTKIVSSISSVMSAGDSSANQFIAIGHSFGARMLFSATNQSLIYDTAKAHPGYPGGVYQKIQGIANAVILLNPAFEAARYTALDATTRSQEVFADDQLPLLLSVSSDGDWATKTAFPLGQWLGFYRSEAQLTTLGNYTEYQTHSLLPISANSCGVSASKNLSERFAAQGLCLARDGIPHNEDKIEQLRTPFFNALTSDIITEVQIVQPRNPFIIARTTSDIIKDHNDIWNPRFSNWLFEYVSKLGNQRRARMLEH